MKFTKEDYMKLSKERLVEMLLEAQERENNDISVGDTPYKPWIITPCWGKDGVCTNPYHDCIDCPRKFGGSGITINGSTSWESGSNFGDGTKTKSNEKE